MYSYETSKKDDFVGGLILMLIAAIILWLVFWGLAGFHSESRCTDVQTVKEVQAVGHKHSTSYYLVGSKGGKIDSEVIKKVGDTACFSYVRENYYAWQPFFTPWKATDE